MEESRVNKYKAYRSQLIREGAENLSSKRMNEIDSSLVDTLNTQTLPINEVYETLDKKEKEEESLLKLEKKKAILKYSFFGALLLLLTIGIIFLAILAFKK